MRLQYIISLGFLMTLISCDCYVKVTGQIVSSSTGKPIKNALVTLIDKNRKVYSDQNGNFLIDMQTGFCFDPKIQVTKKGFKPFQVLISGDSKSISYKIKSESQSVDFDEPLYPDSSNKSTFITGTWIEKYSQDFQSRNDSLIIYLDTDNLEEEIK
ncbi:carboxypeptidase-like regulatory domain-containing protein [uncultured Roseivirga sp.]|uniref:carboxypeptidase-like regulatory domain-containing protein n=1 Tax=uncultured Roseivirga sp. TaxID=543088 RepID=UPI0030D7EEF1